VVAKFAVDEQVLPGKSLAAESEAICKGEGAHVARLHVHFDPIQAELVEGEIERERDAFGHVALSRARLEREIPDEPGATGAVDDVAERDDPRERTGLAHSNQETAPRRQFRTGNESHVARGRGR